MSVTLYVEGGGDEEKLKRECRKGFRVFLENAGLKGKMPSIVACGGRDNAYARFKAQFIGNNEKFMLLVDAEASVPAPATAAQPWQHLQDRDGWQRPPGATDGQCHLMVQTMESWFLADREALSTYYGQGFRGNALPANPHIEQIPKQDVDTGLQSATRDTTKGSYDKGRDSFEILGRLDPAKVTNASPYAKRFIDALTS